MANKTLRSGPLKTAISNGLPPRGAFLPSRVLHTELQVSACPQRYLMRPGQNLNMQWGCYAISWQTV
jgi:hypothetical protein